MLSKPHIILKADKRKECLTDVDRVAPSALSTSLPHAPDGVVHAPAPPALSSLSGAQ